MKYYITRKLKILCLASAFITIASMGSVIYQNIKYSSNIANSLSPIEQVTGSFEPSTGNLYGGIYSLDGVPMLQ